METRYKIRRVPTLQVKEEVVNVGRLDITDYEKTLTESEQADKRVTYGTEQPKTGQMVS